MPPCILGSPTTPWCVQDVVCSSAACALFCFSMTLCCALRYLLCRADAHLLLQVSHAQQLQLRCRGHLQQGAEGQTCTTYRSGKRCNTTTSSSSKFAYVHLHSKADCLIADTKIAEQEDPKESAAGNQARQQCLASCQPGRESAAGSYEDRQHSLSPPSPAQHGTAQPSPAAPTPATASACPTAALAPDDACCLTAPWTEA